MHINDDRSVCLSKAEITCLLLFSSKEAGSRLAGVHLLTNEHGLRARATDGSIACDAIGLNNHDVDGDWFVDRKFLSSAAKTLEKDQLLCLRFSGASLREASIEGEGEIELSRFSWSHDAAIAQAELPNVDRLDEALDTSGAEPCDFLLLSPLTAKLAIELCKASGAEAARLYQREDQPRLVIASEGATTSWYATGDLARPDGEADA